MRSPARATTCRARAARSCRSSRETPPPLRSEGASPSFRRATPLGPDAREREPPWASRRLRPPRSVARAQPAGRAEAAHERSAAGAPLDVPPGRSARELVELSVELVHQRGFELLAVHVALVGVSVGLVRWRSRRESDP